MHLIKLIYLIQVSYSTNIFTSILIKSQNFFYERMFQIKNIPNKIKNISPQDIFKNKKYIIITIPIFFIYCYKLTKYKIHNIFFRNTIFNPKNTKSYYFINNIFIPHIKNHLSSKEYDKFIIYGNLEKIPNNSYEEYILDLSSLNNILFNKIKNIIKNFNKYNIDFNIPNESKQIIKFNLNKNFIPHIKNKTLYTLQIHQEGLIPNYDLYGKCPITAFQASLYILLYNINKLNNHKEKINLYINMQYLNQFLENFIKEILNNPYNQIQLKESLITNNIIKWSNTFNNIEFSNLTFKKINPNITNITDEEFYQIIANIANNMGFISNEIHGDYNNTPFINHISIPTLVGALLNKNHEILKYHQIENIFNFTNTNFGLPLIQSKSIDPFLSSNLKHLNLVRPGHIEYIFPSFDENEINELINFLNSIFNKLNKKILDHRFYWSFSKNKYNL